MRKFIVDENFWKIFPTAKIAVLTVKNVKEFVQLDEKSAAEIKQLLDDANKKSKKYLPSDVISENPVIRVWREAYAKFPTKKGARCSIESLLKRVLHDHPVKTIAPTVDITNAISLKYAFPIGAENMDAFVGDIHVGIMKGGEDFWPIGSDKPEPPLAGEIAYYDEAGVICRCWNWRDGKRTEVTDETTTEFMAMECIEPERYSQLEEAIDELEDLLRRYVGAETMYKAILDKEHSEMNIQD
ncbi:B3/B4 domain-containing protein [Bulleidia extructa]